MEFLTIEPEEERHLPAVTNEELYNSFVRWGGNELMVSKDFPAYRLGEISKMIYDRQIRETYVRNLIDNQEARHRSLMVKKSGILDKLLDLPDNAPFSDLERALRIIKTELGEATSFSAVKQHVTSENVNINLDNTSPELMEVAKKFEAHLSEVLKKKDGSETNTTIKSAGTIEHTRVDTEQSN
jgi:hypothetical protein